MMAVRPLHPALIGSIIATKPRKREIGVRRRLENRNQAARRRRKIAVDAPLEG